MDPNGKWTPEEHALFLRAKQRYKDNIESIIKAIQKVMPGIYKYFFHFFFDKLIGIKFFN